MKKFRFLMPLGFLLIIALFSTIVMLLWNWLIPTLFGLAVINFWQAAGLLILARIFFGGLSFGRNMMFHGNMNSWKRNPIHRKWQEMTPEQRKKFIEKRRQFGFGHPFDREFFDIHEHQEQNKDNE